MKIPRMPKNLAIGLVRNIPLVNDIIDGTQMTDDEIVQKFKEYTDAFDEEFVKELFYGGIATDIEERDSRHSLKGHILCVDVGNKQRCIEIERRLCSDLNIWIGKEEKESAGNGARKTTHLVYLQPRCHRDFRP